MSLTDLLVLWTLQFFPHLRSHEGRDLPRMRYLIRVICRIRAYLDRQPGGGVPHAIRSTMRGEIIGLVTNFFIVGHVFLTDE
jgi:hypothetical protein